MKWKLHIFFDVTLLARISSIQIVLRLIQTEIREWMEFSISFRKLWISR